MLDDVVYIFHSASTLEKGMNPTILFPAMGKVYDRLDSLNSVW